MTGKMIFPREMNILDRRSVGEGKRRKDSEMSCDSKAKSQHRGSVIYGHIAIFLLHFCLVCLMFGQHLAVFRDQDFGN